MPARIIPGVDVRVLRELVPPPATPAGILALVGVAQKAPPELKQVESFPEFRETYGAATNFSIPEARQAFLNGIRTLVVSPVSGGQKAVGELKDKVGNIIVKLEARTPGIWANDKINVIVKNNGASVDMTIKYENRTEEFRNLTMNFEDSGNYLFDRLNRGSELITAKDPGQALPKSGNNIVFDSSTRTDGRQFKRLTDNNSVEVVELITKEPASGSFSADITAGEPGTVTLRIDTPAGIETFENVNMDPGSDDYLVFKIQDDPNSSITAIDLPINPDVPLPPLSASIVLKKGQSPGSDDYQSAIDRLEKDTSIDMVLASVPASEAPDFLKDIYSSVEAHCRVASESAFNRIGLGGIPASFSQNDTTGDVVSFNTFNSQRFVLVAPAGVAGAVAGRIGSIAFFQSPTFKTLAGVPEPLLDYSNGDLRKLLQANVLPVDRIAGRGFVILRGLDTSGSQISVTRIADRAVRRVKTIGDQFIGTLNTDDGRNALRQKIVEFFTQMEKDGAIVPSTDGSQPAFIVDVYSSQADFAQGIVRVDIAVRPVRSIDFIYATILVKS